MFSKKATKNEKNLHRRLDTYFVNVKSMVKIWSIFVAFLENMNFNIAIDGARQHIHSSYYHLLYKSAFNPTRRSRDDGVLKMHPTTHRNQSKIFFYKSYGDLSYVY